MHALRGPRHRHLGLRDDDEGWAGHARSLLIVRDNPSTVLCPGDQTLQ